MSANASAQIRNASRISAMTERVLRDARVVGLGRRSSTRDLERAAVEAGRREARRRGTSSPPTLDVAAAAADRAPSAPSTCPRRSGRPRVISVSRPVTRRQQVRVRRPALRDATGPSRPAGLPSASTMRLTRAARRPSSPARLDRRLAGRASSRTPDARRRARRAPSSRCSSAARSPSRDRGGERLSSPRRSRATTLRALARLAVEPSRGASAPARGARRVLPSSESRDDQDRRRAPPRAPAGSPGG